MKRFALGIILCFAHAVAFAATYATQLPTTGTLTGLSLVQKINEAHETLQTNYSGSGSPGAIGAYKMWADTGTNTLWMRNAANTGWVKIAPLLAELSTVDASTLTAGVVASARLPSASTTAAGIVQLNDSSSSTSTTLAATSNAVRTAYVTAANAQASANAAASYAAAAFCAFNGATTGTHACTLGRGVTSVQRTGTGVYTINLSTALTANYAFFITPSLAVFLPVFCVGAITSSTVANIGCVDTGGVARDPGIVNIVFFDS